MAKAQRMAYFRINVEDKPGALLAIAKDLKSKNVGLAALVGLAPLKALEQQPGQSSVYLIAKNPDKLRNALKSPGMMIEEGTIFFVKGADKTGALLKTLETIAQAGINIIATDALAVSGSYGALFRVAPADVERAAKALGAK